MIDEKDRNANIDIFRFIFCFLIINYHLFSHYFRNIEFPNYFIRGYMGDEFFFIITGYYFAEAAVKNKERAIKWNLIQTAKRIKKIAIPYYITWVLCFVGRAFTSYRLGENRNVLLDILNSVYELLFLEMFGFKKGLYSNDVGWFFSALLIVLCVLGPLVAKHKKSFSLYVAPLIAFFSYGILSLSFDYLHDPYLLIPNTYIMKGIIRALAAICVGIFINGLIRCDYTQTILNRITPIKRKVVLAFDVLLWIGIIYYMMFPFSSNAEVLSVQYDYIIVIIMAIALFPLFCNLIIIQNQKIHNLARILGKYSFYAYFGQAVFYSIDKLVYRMEFGIAKKAIILNVTIPIISLFIWLMSYLITKNISIHIKKYK